MKGTLITPVLARLIALERAEGKSIRFISEKFGISKTSIGRHIKSRREGPQLVKRARGRPRITSEAVDKHILLTVKRHRFATFRELAVEFNISKQTIRRRCRAGNINRRIALEEELTRRHKRVRVEWCRTHRNENFNKWLFSDESSFELSNLSIPRRQYVSRRTKEKYARCCIIQGGLRNIQKVMVWGAISCNGPACFAILNRNVNAHQYIQTLNTNLIPYLDNIPLNQAATLKFQHDNAPPHRAYITRDFLAHNAISVPLWPPLSPDLNPIEFVWGAMKRRVRKSRPQSIPALRIAIRIAWNAVCSEEFCGRLYARQHAQMKKVINRRGSR